MRRLIFGLCLTLVACSPPPANIFAAVDEDKGDYVRDWIKGGGNPNTIDNDGGSLFYIATGPHGGHSALKALLEGGADPNIGAGGYTPLMNAASWVDLQGVRILLEHGANPNLKNESGQTALDVVGSAGGRERAVIEELQKVTHAK